MISFHSLLTPTSPLKSLPPLPRAPSILPFSLPPLAFAYQVTQYEKRDKLIEYLDQYTGEKSLVFVEQKRNADFLASYLSQSGYPTTSIHGDRLQREREEALRDFNSKKNPVLIATNVAARGLDIPEVKVTLKNCINSSLAKTLLFLVERHL